MAESPPKENDIARKIRARGLAHGRTPPQIAQEIHDQCGTTFGISRVKAQRLALGVALSDVVAQIRALYEVEGKAEPKLGETLLSAYESSHKRPGPEYLHYLCSVYQVDPEDLGYQGSCICGRRHSGRMASERRKDATDGTGGHSRNRTGSIVVPPVEDPYFAARTSKVDPREPAGRGSAPGPASAAAGEEEIVLRRTLLQLLAGAGVALDGQFLGAVDHVRRRMDDTLISATVSSSMLDQWEEATLGYGQQYQATPSLRVLCDVLLDFGEVRRMCAQRQPIELQERLCRIAAQLAGLCGRIMNSLGDHRMARSFFRTARTAADETGDRALRAWVTAREALVPMYYGDPREALHLARKAQDQAGRTPCVAAAMAPAIEARALGQLALRGRADAAPSARRALVRGRAVFEQLPKRDTGDLAFGFTERQLAFYEGDTYTNLGDTHHAEEGLSHALTLYPAQERIDRTLVRLDRAICKVQLGEPEHALAVGRAAILELPDEHRSDMLMHRGRQLAAAVVKKHGDMPAVRDFHDALAGPSAHSPTMRPPVAAHSPATSA
ncbi:MAG TPA: XRE family transcriptional regulator [Streptosporangiaceae bacterium]|nr:XRE family transcriptional regulator [Streptosporangiaceae bacterium]